MTHLEEIVHLTEQCEKFLNDYRFATDNGLELNGADETDFSLAFHLAQTPGMELRARDFDEMSRGLDGVSWASKQGQGLFVMRDDGDGGTAYHVSGPEDAAARMAERLRAELPALKRMMRDCKISSAFVAAWPELDAARAVIRIPATPAPMEGMQF